MVSHDYMATKELSRKINSVSFLTRSGKDKLTARGRHTDAPADKPLRLFLFSRGNYHQLWD